LVTIKASKCIGCRRCVMACPSGHINYNQNKGAAYKCDLCGGQPQCAKYCWTGAITFELIEDTTRHGLAGSPV
jgi:Fe-S-cluster-containing dehydrogenase component